MKKRCERGKCAMYIWLGIDVDSQLCELKEMAMRTERDLGLTPS